MVKIELPDGSIREYERPVTPMEVAEDISPGLARSSVAATVDEENRDLSFCIQDGTHTVRLLTDRDPESLEVLRHTAAHVMAQAVKRMFGQDVKFGFGPALTDDFQYGFYYDMDLPDPVTADDLPRIEDEMRRIVEEDIPVEHLVMSIAEARAIMAESGQDYKIRAIDSLVAEEGVEELSFYRVGEFIDLCRGPHLPNTGTLGTAFTLQATAGAYWLGDQKNPMLTRIYGTAFFDKKTLKRHLERIAEAKKRDHRIIGKELNLFVIDDEVGPGLPLWLPAGATIKMELENWLRGELIRAGYQMVYSPHIGRLGLYETSGHYPYYSNSQFPPIITDDSEGEGYLVKPMNCPHHLRMYKHSQHSYRDLPLRLAEFGQVYRRELSGELNGLTRVRGFCQDDAHIFCTPQQLESELASCIGLTKMVLTTLGLDDYRVRIGLRDPDDDKYVGGSENWDLAEDNLRSVVNKQGMSCVEEPGEAAFYGPKIDFIVTDCIGREWQLGTVQVDYNLPERFELEYIGPDNAPHRPVMIHRAPFGSFERFIGILIEHYAGAFPLWLSPVQVAVLPVSDRFADYATDLSEQLKDAGFRVNLDDSSGRIGGRIRSAEVSRVPYMAVVGAAETENGTVAVRIRGRGDIGQVPVDEFISGLRREKETRGAEKPLEADTPLQRERGED